ncbi:MAG: metal ABC transporter solute-binding protein, Zn/Mn family, partial [Methermicoccaceae archaeon]
TNRAFLVYHPAFGYFANEYNLTQIAVERGGKEPTPQVIQTCIEQAERYNLSYVYVEPQFSTREAQTIADAIGGSILYMDPLPRDYIANMRKVASSLSLECEG